MKTGLGAFTLSCSSVKAHGPFLSVWGVSVMGVIAGHLEAARFWLEMTSYSVAILAGGYNLYMIFRKRFDDKVERARREIEKTAREHQAKLDEIQAELKLLHKNINHRRKP